MSFVEGRPNKCPSFLVLSHERSSNFNCTRKMLRNILYGQLRYGLSILVSVDINAAS